MVETKSLLEGLVGAHKSIAPNVIPVRGFVQPGVAALTAAAMWDCGIALMPRVRKLVYTEDASLRSFWVFRPADQLA